MARVTAGLILSILVVGLFGCATATGRITRIPTWKSTYEPPTTNGHQAQYDELRARAVSWGFTILDSVETINQFFEENPQTNQLGEANGMASLEHKIIILDPEMAADGKLEVLAHEMGHFFQPSVFSSPGYYAEREVFAEFVSRKVTEYYEVEGAQKRSDYYLAGYKTGLHILPTVKVDIEEAYEHIIGLRTAPIFK